MKMSIRRLTALLLAVVMILALTACGGGNAPTKDDAAQGGTASADPAPAASTKDNLVIALPGEPQSLDPYAHSMY